MIIDAHHHIWRRADLPWLLGPTQPRIFGNYDAIKRDYPIEEFLADAAPCGVTHSVYVQANWAANWFLDEARFVAQAAERTGAPHATVAFCNMFQDDARRDLDALSRIPLVRGVRHQMHHHHNPLYRFAPTADAVARPAVARNVAALADYGFVFELQVFAPQIEAALTLVEACPGTTFVLQHALMLEDLSDEGRAAWRTALGRLAAHENVVCKLSGLGTFLRANDAAHIAFVAEAALGAFGAERCLFGSNFPIEKLWTDYGALFGAIEAAVGEARHAVFCETAARVYAIPTG
ncbi:MAG: amidohydrolase family protein [Pseudomonadota bacterium]